jgi:hypothetical protein
MPTSHFHFDIPQSLQTHNIENIRSRTRTETSELEEDVDLKESVSDERG